MNFFEKTHISEILHRGELVVIPTETVYGLAADATNDLAVGCIYTLKNRPSFNPLIIHVCDIEMAQRYIEVNEDFLTLAKHFWLHDQRSISFVCKVKSNSGLSRLVTAGLSTVAVRMPHHWLAQEIIRDFDRPLAAPSANPSNKISPTTAEHVRLAYGDRCPLIVDGGACQVGLESTILDLTGEKLTILRKGAVTAEEIADVIGHSVHYANHEAAITAPGMQKRHYAPDCPVFLNHQGNVPEGFIKLGFGPDETAMLNLSPTGDLLEAAANLFNYMHKLNAMKPKGICVASIPNNGLGYAINDRLMRAASEG